ncbi:MFS transporter [Sanguibacter sp. Leaf3]|uniref:MFS transporter n=1 Tax=Sanguibacter sp. Leaf3 TaxID=1736209 RepID=UPI0006FC26A5|nr:MFS transporter [Sanguibacter sp. Leaf3]KQT97924.1 hypothetical protein ASG53_09245 [Sanguibacter sp. Leaf3]
MSEIHTPAASAGHHAAGPAGPREPLLLPRSYLTMLGLGNFGLYFAVLTPVFVSLAFKLQHITETPSEAAAALGLVSGVGALFALVVNPMVGRLSDRTTSRFGMRRPWILGGALLTLAALTLIGAAESVWVALVGWCLVQAGVNGSLAAFNATISDQVPVARRGLASGIVGVTTSLAILAGSFAVNFIDSDLLRFVVPGIVALVFVALFSLVLHDKVLETKPATRYGVRDFFGSFIFNPRKHPDFGWTWLTTFLVMFGYAGVATFLPLYLTERFELDERTAITFILVCNIASTIGLAISGPLAGVLSDRLGRRRPFVAAASLIMVSGLVVLAFAPSLWVVVAGQAIIGLGAGAFQSVSLALATQVLPDQHDVAKDLGMINVANALPQSIAPAIAPAVIALGATTAIGGYSLFYLVAAVVAVTGAITVYRIKEVR